MAADRVLVLAGVAGALLVLMSRAACASSGAAAFVEVGRLGASAALAGMDSTCETTKM